MTRTPINRGLLQSDLDFANFKAAHADLSDYAGANMDWNPATKQFDSSIGTVLGKRVNVRDAPYNAHGDGTTDDTAAIQNAINDVVNAGGGTVFFPKGIYLCNGPFDTYWKSILTLPFLDNNTVSPVSLELLGEVMPTWTVVAAAQNYQFLSTIRTTRTDGMTADTNGFAAIIAGGQPKGNAIVTNYGTMNGLMVKVKNMQFQCPSDPTMGGIRFDGLGWAFVENTVVYAGGAEPTHGTTGVWMPNCINWSISWMNHVISGNGFDTGFKIGEHLRAPMIQAWACKNGVTFLDGVYPSWANIQLGNCVEGIQFLGYHPVDLLLETEHSPASDWTVAAHDVKDPSNKGLGVIRYFIGQGGAGNASIVAAVNGGTGLTLIDLNSGNVTMNTTYGAAGGAPTFKGNILAAQATANVFYIGTDARLVPVSGGVKVEVRNITTGTWLEATRWTNP